MNLHTWKDCDLRELVDLIKLHNMSYIRTDLSFNFYLIENDKINIG